MYELLYTPSISNGIYGRSPEDPIEFQCISLGSMLDRVVLHSYPGPEQLLVTHAMFS